VTNSSNFAHQNEKEPNLSRRKTWWPKKELSGEGDHAQTNSTIAGGRQKNIKPKKGKKKTASKPENSKEIYNIDRKDMQSNSGI